ncbi:MAG: hypothetical protein U1F33_12295 [Alphaproteobacteria bacterium]
MIERDIRRGMATIAVGAALIALPCLAVAQSGPPAQPRPASSPVVLGATVTGAIGQHTADSLRQGIDLAAQKRDAAR